MFNAEELKWAYLHCIVQGDQEMWKMIYPALIQNGYAIDKEILDYFSCKT